MEQNLVSERRFALLPQTMDNGTRVWFRHYWAILEPAEVEYYDEDYGDSWTEVEYAIVSLQLAKP